MTISDTRTSINDKSGDILSDLIKRDGHILIERTLLKDDIIAIAQQLSLWIENSDIDVVIGTGGTGLTGRDVTPEAFESVYEKKIDGFGELFRFLSYSKIGTSALQSRCTAGLARGTYLFALPGSPSACKDGWEEILKFQLDNRYRPCNLVELMPRLKEK